MGFFFFVVVFMPGLAYFIHVWPWKHNRNPNDLTMLERGKSYTDQWFKSLWEVHRLQYGGTAPAACPLFSWAFPSPRDHISSGLVQQRWAERVCKSEVHRPWPKVLQWSSFSTSQTPWRSSPVSPDFTWKPLHVSSPPYFEIRLTPANSQALKIIIIC